MQHINYCSHAGQLIFNCHKGGGGGGGRIMAQLFILSYSNAVSFSVIRGHLGTIPSIVTFIFFVAHFNIRLYGKLSESDYFFFLHQKQNIFFSNIGNQNIFLEKNHNPPSSS